MRAITYQVRFAGPTSYRGARWHVTRLTDRARRTAPFDYELGHGSEGKVAAVMLAFPDEGDRRIVWSGEKGLSNYYTEVIDDGV